MPILPPMRDESDFLVYTEAKGVPLLAGCKKCGLKFLTPPKSREQSLAKSYLWDKFVVHLCTGGPTKTAFSLAGWLP